MGTVPVAHFWLLTNLVDGAILCKIEIDQFGRKRKEAIFIYEHFEILDEEKQQRIVNAALREFGRFGYRKTSVQQIIESAGIAKGMLFHYFGSKLGLFEYLSCYTTSCIEKYFGTLNEKLQGLDDIEQYRLTTKVKLEAYLKNPEVFAFMTMLFMHPENQDVSEVVRANYDELMTLRSAALVAIQISNDPDNYRHDIPVEKAKKYLAWIIDGYAQTVLAEVSDGQLDSLADSPYWDEFDEILDDMKKLFYRS